MSKAIVQDDDMAPPSLADMVRRLRGKSTQQNFAQAVGVSDSLIAHVERGTRSLSVDNVEKIIRSLGLDGDEAVALRRARDRMSGTKEPSIPAQIAKLERTISAQLDHLEKSVSETRGEVDGRIDSLAAVVGEVAEQVRILYRALLSYQAGESTLPDQAPAQPQQLRRRSQRPSPPKQ